MTQTKAREEAERIAEQMADLSFDLSRANIRMIYADLLVRFASEIRAEAVDDAANIALAIDSGRGNEKEIAAAIRQLALPPPPQEG